MFDFGYDFLQGLQQIEIYKGAMVRFLGQRLLWSNKFITDIDYENSLSFSGSHSRDNH